MIRLRFMLSALRCGFFHRPQRDRLGWQCSICHLRFRPAHNLTTAVKALESQLRRIADVFEAAMKEAEAPLAKLVLPKPGPPRYTTE